jgi:DNA primase
MISFVEEMEGLDFIGAVKILAERAGVKLTPFNNKESQKKVRLYQALAEAARFYQSQLTANQPVLAYLTERGLRPETITKFGLGFAPGERAAAWEYLRSKGFSPAEVEGAGLIIRSQRDGQYFDRFRGRIMFPLADLSGRVVGFSGRIWGEARAEVAKYINSPQTLVYDKSSLLYGYDKAKLAIRRQETCVLVEGQFDLLLSHQVGVENTVAVSGTALTEQHFREAVKRLAKKVVVAFDGDGAGQTATRRAIGLLLSQGFDVRLVALPEGVDPAEFIREHPDQWPKIIEAAEPVIDFLLASVSKRASGHERAALTREEIYPYLVALPNRLEQAHFINKVAGSLGLKEEVVSKDLAEWRRSYSPGRDADAIKPPTLAHEPAPTRRERVAERLLGLWWWRPALAGETLNQLLAEPASPAGGPVLQAEIERLEGRKEHLILQTELLYEGKQEDKLVVEVEDLVRQWRLEVLKEQLQEAMVKLTEAERARDKGLIERYLADCQKISQAINSL